MKVLRKLFVPLIAVAGLALNFAGCGKDSSVNPQEPKVPGRVAQSDIGTIHILEVDAKLSSLFKGEIPDSVFYAEKFIKTQKGGELKVGNKEYGETKIKFCKHDLPQDMTIKLQWAVYGTLQGMLTNVEFGPHGTNFNNPVKLELSYKMADLTGVDEDNLRVFYFNEDTGFWELIGGTVDLKKRKIKVDIWHFSRYAVAHSQ